MREIPPLKKLIIPTLFLAALFAAQSWRSQARLPHWRIHGEVMGTTYSIQVIHARRPDEAALHGALEAVNQRMSTYLKTSELSALNAHDGRDAQGAPAPFPLSDPLRRVLAAAREVSEASGGAFDVTVAPLVDAWGFGPDGRVTPPSPERVAALKAQAGYAQLTLTPAGALKGHPALRCDLSAIAKGYGVDEAARWLEAAGYDRYWVEVGGEVRARGKNADGVDWRAGVERPAAEGRRAVERVIPLRDISIATSGDYRNRYIDAEGVARSHTIDPRTGAPITHALASISVLHPENMYADAWATALNVLGPEEGLRVAEARRLPALLLVREPGADPRDPAAPVRPVLTTALRDYLRAVEGGEGGD